ncbi:MULTISPECIES: hypothetical protein, partial [unclassified Enterobacter]|uniref:hypothetical protein n=1 Tax=unclassified Enterobacter TaxID=2608935 RepID=UPI001A924D94
IKHPFYNQHNSEGIRRDRINPMGTGVNAFYGKKGMDAIKRSTGISGCYSKEIRYRNACFA